MAVSRLNLMRTNLKLGLIVHRSVCIYMNYLVKHFLNQEIEKYGKLFGKLHGFK